MLIFETVYTLRQYLDEKRREGKTVGFVPTMGALHNGHLQLMATAKEHSDISVCCIFVNPTQFNEKADLKSYPRPIAADTKLLEEVSCDILFWPTVEEVYPGDWEASNIDISKLAGNMEGTHRPGHFEGMVQVVERLLNIVKPDEIIMGQKDFQQFTIVQYMIDQLQLPVRLRVAPTVRESDGLAMSSRNLLLTDKFRRSAVVINQALSFAKRQIGQMDIPTIESKALEMIRAEGLTPEYFDIVNAQTLQAVKNSDEAHFLVACTAAKAGDVRLIDNMILKGSPD